MEFNAQTITNLVGLILATCAIIGVISRTITKLEERHNRQRAEDIARQEAQRQEDKERQEAQRQEDREELRDIKDHVYNHLPTQIRAIEREIKGLRDMIVKYIFDKSVSETKHEEQD